MLAISVYYVHKHHIKYCMCRQEDYVWGTPWSELTLIVQVSTLGIRVALPVILGTAIKGQLFQLTQNSVTYVVSLTLTFFLSLWTHRVDRWLSQGFLSFCSFKAVESHRKRAGEKDWVGTGTWQWDGIIAGSKQRASTLLLSYCAFGPVCDLETWDTPYYPYRQIYFSCPGIPRLKDSWIRCCTDIMLGIMAFDVSRDNNEAGAKNGTTAQGGVAFPSAKSIILILYIRTSQGPLSCFTPGCSSCV